MRVARRDSRLLAPGAEIMKAQGLRRIRLAPGPGPTAAEVEHERALFGPHENPAMAFIEDGLYLLGSEFLSNLYSAVLGVKRPRLVQKADDLPSDWGQIAKLFQAGGDPGQLTEAWTAVLDNLLARLLPAAKQTDASAVWALRTSLVSKIGERATAVASGAGWSGYLRDLPNPEAQQLEWTRLRGAQHITNLSNRTRAAVLDALVAHRASGQGVAPLATTLLRTFGELNRDWRRIAVTETAMASEAGKLAALDLSEPWEAVWVAGPKACPFCKRMNGRTFRVVASDAEGKDGQTQVWAGKNNIGRSASLRTRDGRERVPSELWWPCIPAHPLCMCSWTVRRVAQGSRARAAAEDLRRKQAARYAAAAAGVR